MNSVLARTVSAFGKASSKTSKEGWKMERQSMRQMSANATEEKAVQTEHKEEEQTAGEAWEKQNSSTNFWKKVALGVFVATLTLDIALVTYNDRNFADPLVVRRAQSTLDSLASPSPSPSTSSTSTSSD